MKEQLNRITEEVIGAALAVHRELGPGLLESACEACLAYELIDRGHTVERQKPLRLLYRGQDMNCGYRLDMLVDHLVVVEVKSIEHFDHIHTAQMISYLKMAGCRVGLLINFNVAYLTRDGIKRVVNNFPDA